MLTPPKNLTSFMCLKTVFKISCSVTFAETEMKLNGLELPVSSVLAFFKKGATFSFLHNIYSIVQKTVLERGIKTHLYVLCR